ncbi:MAG: RagB/SusD family nutrient uptake outer membrane protein [Bacteroidales bacterium]|nr:RagB/SusD family nutrient uptake outer membrane protein [Bacteroidales bacterium]
MKSNMMMVLLACLAVSCADMLNQYPNAAIAPDAVTEKDLPSMRYGMYNAVQNGPGVYSYMCFDLFGGDVTTPNLNPIDVINSYFSPLNSYTTGQWGNYFATLYEVNNVLEVIERFPNAENSSMIRGEAHYFRAWIYMNLLIRYGDVPILRTNTMEKVRRDPVEKVWAFIDEDLENAAKYVVESGNYYMVSPSAVTALTARVRLYEKRYSEAAALAESLITGGLYQLDDFSSIFGTFPEESRKTNKETIFAFSNYMTESSNNISSHYYTYGHPNKGMGTYRLTADIVNSFTSNDKRKSISIINIEGTDCLNKYPSGQAGTDPFIVSRIAEMYLISAEAQGFDNQVANGLARLNELRSKRGLAAVSASNAQELLDLVLEERRLELLGENHMWYDWIRTDKAVQRLGIREYQKLFPISGKELQLNRLLEQNYGY